MFVTCSSADLVGHDALLMFTFASSSSCSAFQIDGHLSYVELYALCRRARPSNFSNKDKLTSWSNFSCGKCGQTETSWSLATFWQILPEFKIFQAFRTPSKYDTEFKSVGFAETLTQLGDLTSPMSGYLVTKKSLHVFHSLPSPQSF